MLNIDDVNLLQSEMVKRSSKGGGADKNLDQKFTLTLV